VEYTPIEEDTTRATALETDDVDAFATVPPQLWDTVEQAEDAEVIDTTGLTYFYAGFNFEGGPTADARVRHAIDYCFSIEDGVEAFVEPAGERTHSILPEPLAREWGFPYDEGGDRWHDRDIDQARDLFEEAGVSTDYTFDILTPGGDAREDFAVSISNGIQEAGYDAQVQRLDRGALSEIRERMDPDEINVYLSGLIQGPDPDLFIYRLLHTEGNWYQPMNYENPEFHDKIDQARQTVDEDERFELYLDIIDTYIEDRLHIPTHNRAITAAANDRVNAFTMHSVDSINPPLFTARREPLAGIEGRNVWVDR